jgi:mannose/cellobiose epimerase-like protein (N-acyl-D-glucosamine 2-epimerase family)
MDHSQRYGLTVFSFGGEVYFGHNSSMTSRDNSDPKIQLRTLRDQLAAWLINDAYPLWAAQGVDAHGGFFETLGFDGRGLADPRRARVHPRQVYAFAQASRFGWRGDANRLVRRGIDYFMAHYQRTDGLFRTLADAAGKPLDERALLYDQAFALLGFAAAATALNEQSKFEARALELRGAILSCLGADDGAFYSDLELRDRRESNPHMHLLEACLAWAEISSDPSWLAWVRRLVELAVTHFIRDDCGAIGESFTDDWKPAPGNAGRIIEPGHQFEWAWLLLRSEHIYYAPLRQTALQLLNFGEQFGVHRGVAVNQLRDDTTVADADARFWPQTERLKASLLAASLTQKTRYWWNAHAAALSLLPYMKTAVPGLWFDLQRPSGDFTGAAVPASTFYHLVVAIEVLTAALPCPV